MNNESLSVNAIHRHEPPEPAVVAVVPVVAHHEDRALGNHQGKVHVPPGRGTLALSVDDAEILSRKSLLVPVERREPVRAVPDVIPGVDLGDRTAVYQDVSARHVYFVSRDPHRSLYVENSPGGRKRAVGRGVLVELENHHVAALNPGEGKEQKVRKGNPGSVQELVYENMISHQKRGKHGARRNLERLYDESPNGESQNHRHRDGFHVLSHRGLVVGLEVVVEKEPESLARGSYLVQRAFSQGLFARQDPGFGVFGFAGSHEISFFLQEISYRPHEPPGVSCGQAFSQPLCDHRRAGSGEEIEKEKFPATPAVFPPPNRKRIFTGKYREAIPRNDTGSTRY